MKEESFWDCVYLDFDEYPIMDDDGNYEDEILVYNCKHPKRTDCIMATEYKDCCYFNKDRQGYPKGDEKE